MPFVDSTYASSEEINGRAPQQEMDWGIDSAMNGSFHFNEGYVIRPVFIILLLWHINNIWQSLHYTYTQQDKNFLLLETKPCGKKNSP